MRNLSQDNHTGQRRSSIVICVQRYKIAHTHQPIAHILLGLTHHKNDLLEGITKKIKRLLRGDSRLSSEQQRNFSEVSFHFSEVSFHSSEVSFHSSELLCQTSEEFGISSGAFGKLLPKNWSLEETVAKVNSLTILLARLSRLCRKDEAQGAEGEV